MTLETILLIALIVTAALAAIGFLQKKHAAGKADKPPEDIADNAADLNGKFSRAWHIKPCIILKSPVRRILLYLTGAASSGNYLQIAKSEYDAPR